MGTRKVQFAPHEYYHLYNRGNSKQKIFLDDHDYIRFLKLLYVANGTSQHKIRDIKNIEFEADRGNPLVNIEAYCLMPNHFHILITQPENGEVSKFMQKLTTGYSMFFNKKYERTGGLFEGRFKSEHVNDDVHLRYLFSYIHLNPVKLIDPEWKEKGISNSTRALSYLKNYPYSSFPDYYNYTVPACVNRKEFSILSPETFLGYFPDSRSYERELLEWLTYSAELLELESNTQ